MATNSGEFEYDVAISFAGENRPIVEQFATLLKAAGFSVFYDDWEKSSLWGKDLYQHLDEVYTQKAQFCVIFLSAAYAAKVWTNHELKSAQTRAFKEKKEYILPVRLDDTAIPGIRETVGYLDLRKLSVEQVAELASEKIGAAKAAAIAPPSRKARTKKASAAVMGKVTAPAAKGKTASVSAVVESAGDWILLRDRFYQAQSVESPDDKRFVVTLVTTDAASDGQLEAIRNQRNSGERQVSFAYANDAFVVRCESASSTYEGGVHKWRVVLLKEDIQYGGHLMEMAYSDGSNHYSAEQFAKMRAERILFGAHAAPQAKRGAGYDVSGSMIESFIQGSNTPLKVTASPIQELAKKMSCDAALFLCFARLLTLFYLKAGGVVEQIERLALGPIKGKSVHVIFRGRRGKKYSNVDPEVIELESDCPLP